MIRPAVHEDVPAIVEMCVRFAALEYPTTMRLNPERAEHIARGLIESHDGALFVSAHGTEVTGYIGVMVFEHPMSCERTAMEVAWWMQPEHRGGRAALRLLRAATDWAKAHGALALQMIAPTDHVGTFYERLGFTRIETHYMRAL